MSPALQPKTAPGGRKISRPSSIDRISQTTRNAASRPLEAKRQRDFDPHAFLATIGKGRKVLNGSKETSNLRARGRG